MKEGGGGVNIPMLHLKDELLLLPICQIIPRLKGWMKVRKGFVIVFVQIARVVAIPLLVAATANVLLAKGRALLFGLLGERKVTRHL